MWEKFKQVHYMFHIAGLYHLSVAGVIGRIAFVLWVGI